MSRTCYICDKGTISGRSIKRKGLAKRKGGVGKRITGKNLRKFKPNLKKIKISEDGKTKKVTVCTKCLKAGKVQKVI